MSEKIQKVLAREGFGSRRQMETAIASGRVTLNGKVATIGDRAITQDVIALDGKKISFTQQGDNICRVLLYYKQEKELCTRFDAKGRKTVFDRLPMLSKGRWISVGRLDYNTSGILLFTNDGELANRLMHPSSGITRRYAVRVFGNLTNNMIENLQKGVQLDCGFCKFNTIEAAGGLGINQWFYVTLNEGKNREVRKLIESQGLQVSRLIRVNFADLSLPKGLPAGAWKELNLQEVNKYRSLVSLPREQQTFVKPDANKKRIKTAKLRRIVNKFNLK